MADKNFCLTIADTGIGMTSDKKQEVLELTYVNSTFREVFDLKQDDVFWCTADVGWITGHSYVLYGPLSNGTTTVMFEGIPQYPSWARTGQDRRGFQCPPQPASRP